MYHTKSNLVLFFLVTLISLSFLVLGCERDSAASSPSNPQAGVEASSQDNGSAIPDEEQAGEVPPGNLYPGITLDSLRPGERRTFVSVAEAELCPCPDSTISLHQCLQDESLRCELAMEVARVVGTSIREGLNHTDVLSRVATFVETANKRHSFALSGAPHKGPQDAPVVIVEFADFLCPHCRHASNALEQIHKRYGDKVVIYFKQFPFGRPESRMAARASLAAHLQGRFWPMHDLLFRYQGQLSPSHIERFAHQIGLNYKRFQEDMESPKVEEAISNDRQEGRRAEVQGTPTIFINGRLHVGDFNVAHLSQAIDAELRSLEQAKNKN